MNFNYPEFLGEGPRHSLNNASRVLGRQEENQGRNNGMSRTSEQVVDMGSSAGNTGPGQQSMGLGTGGLGSMWFNQLSNLDGALAESPTSGPRQDMNMPIISPLLDTSFSPNLMSSGGPYLNDFSLQHQVPQPDTFNLPSELQGGISTISSRRPSYAAESFTRSNMPPNYSSILELNLGHGLSSPSTSFEKQPSNNMTAFALGNSLNYSMNIDQLNDTLNNISLNQKLNDFQSRRPSQLVDFQGGNLDTMRNLDFVNQQPAKDTSQILLENGLVLKDQYIIASPTLKNLYTKTTKYYQDPNMSSEILAKLNSLLKNPVILKLITFIKNLNNLTFNHKTLCLVVNKNGKFDLLSYPNNSNIYLQKEDLVIVDGDRGKDMVMILEPLVSLNFAILFNFLKKLEHLKSLAIIDAQGDSQSSINQANRFTKKVSNGASSTQMNASTIVNSHASKDNEFIITLPTKQVLRFATPKEVHKLSGKFLEEKKAYVTCFNKIKELNLNNSLDLINVEYQFDFKKLIFYYYAGFKRIDFRGLIKELFKIYKTRIWLYAVLPYDRPELYTASSYKDFNTTPSDPKNVAIENHIPEEYELSNEQILNFSINEIDHLSRPNYFHLKNLMNLIDHLSHEIKGEFYGFNTKAARS